MPSMNSINLKITEASPWYLATSKPRQECRAVENLLNQGIKAFCPRIRVEKVRTGRKVEIEEPMFTGYIFVNLSPQDGLWHKVKSTRGIRDWVRFSGEAAKMPEHLVESLLESETKQTNILVKKQYQSGEPVRILSGPFEGLKGIYLSGSGEKRSLILIEFLGNQNRLQVANDQIISE